MAIDSFRVTTGSSRQPKRFSLGIQRFAKKAGQRADYVVKRVGAELADRIVTGTPVDTGAARGNWQVGFNAKPRGTLEVLDKDGGTTIKKLQGEILVKAKFGVQVHFANNLPYITRLEYGWSKQAPNGMVRLAIASQRAMVERATAAAKREFK